jgi:hypothetical protein
MADILPTEDSIAPLCPRGDNARTSSLALPKSCLCVGFVARAQCRSVCECSKRNKEERKLKIKKPPTVHPHVHTHPHPHPHTLLIVATIYHTHTYSHSHILTLTHTHTYILQKTRWEYLATSGGWKTPFQRSSRWCMRTEERSVRCAVGRYS